MVLEVSDIHPGEPVVFAVSGATPGDQVRFVAGRPGAGPCLDVDHCLDIRPRHLLGTVTADAAGEAVLIHDPLSTHLMGQSLGFQAGVASDIKISQRVMREIGVEYATINATAGTVGPGAPSPTGHNQRAQGGHDGDPHGYVHPNRDLLLRRWACRGR